VRVVSSELKDPELERKIVAGSSCFTLPLRRCYDDDHQTTSLYRRLDGTENESRTDVNLQSEIEYSAICSRWIRHVCWRSSCTS